jgi:hypothetical protein
LAVARGGRSVSQGPGKAALGMPLDGEVFCVLDVVRATLRICFFGPSLPDDQKPNRRREEGGLG